MTPPTAAYKAPPPWLDRPIKQPATPNNRGHQTHSSSIHQTQAIYPIKSEAKMPVTELALLRLKAQDAHSSTKSGLLEAQKKQTGYSDYQVTYLRQIEDPSFFYLLGGWESVEKHTGEGQWLSSEVNQKLLARLQSDLDVSWMFHLDLDVSFPPILTLKYFPSSMVVSRNIS